MKSIVVEIRGNFAAVLSDDGCIKKIRNNNYVIGQEVIEEMEKRFSLNKVVLAAAACFVLALGISAFAYFAPYSYVSIDVNPSLEYELNIFDRVISVNGVNDDGSEIVDEITLEPLMYRPVEEAVRATVDEIAQKGYLDDDEAGIVIATASRSSEKAGRMANRLENTANDTCAKCGSSCVATGEAIGKNRVEEARRLHVTPGKLRLVEKLIEGSQDPAGENKEEWLAKSVKEISAHIKENKKSSGGEANANNGNANQGQNNGNQNANGPQNRSETAVCTNECTGECESCQNMEGACTCQSNECREQNSFKASENTSRANDSSEKAGNFAQGSYGKGNN